jgi:type II secretory pathway component GspD/PulD (secretin)
VAAAAATGRYTGQHISLDLQNADLSDVLRHIGTVSGLNIIASGEVKGTITMRLVNVPWDQALEAILKLHGLAQERQGNVILIMSRERFMAQQQEFLRAQQLETQSEAVVTHIVPIQYRDADACSETLQQHGRLCHDLVDRPTNSHIITGTPSCLGRRCSSSGLIRDQIGHAYIGRCGVGKVYHVAWQAVVQQHWHFPASSGRVLSPISKKPHCPLPFLGLCSCRLAATRADDSRLPGGCD